MNNPYVMIVEDERITALEIQARLKKRGYSVSAIAASGAEALEQAQKFRPDIALLDIHLKGNMDGIQTAERLRRHFDIPVIYISAYADKETLKRAKLTGPFGYVLKPIDNRELDATIEMALYKHKIEVELKIVNQQLRASNQQLKASEQRLVDEQKFTDMIIQSTPGLFYIFEKNSTRFVRKNDNWSNVTGYSDEKLDTMTALDFFEKGPDGDLCAEWIQEGYENGFSSMENHLLTRSGNQIPYYFTGQRLDIDGMTYLVGLGLDISKRKQAEEEREKLLKVLSSKNAELLSIVNIVSHDLRTPLINIAGFGRELSDDCKQLQNLMQDATFSADNTKKANTLINEYLPESLQFINASTNKMHMLLDGMIRVSRIGSAAIDIEPLDMNKMLDRVIKTVQFKAKEQGATITADKLPGCLGDNAMINQVFSNLVGNALKYLDAGRKRKIHISGRTEGQMSIYCAEDNGIGIDPEFHGKIFEVFYRLEPGDSAGGEGLGLTIVGRILDRNDGEIRVESEPGKGSRFFISLPAANA